MASRVTTPGRRLTLDARGVASPARQVASPNCDARPPDAVVTMIVVHNISLPPGTFGGDAIERLFTNTLDAAANPAFAEVAHLRVSSHFLIRRDGALLQFVACNLRAWHAGVSSWRGRDAQGESIMNRLFATTAVVLLLGLAPALAAEESTKPPTGTGVSPEAAQQATQPDTGSADTSGGAAEQSSAPPASGAASATKAPEEATNPESGSADTSAGAKEQSSAPPGSSAADTSKPNPTLGGEKSQE